jgi:hypothetical protein
MEPQIYKLVGGVRPQIGMLVGGVRLTCSDGPPLRNVASSRVGT